MKYPFVSVITILAKWAKVSAISKAEISNAIDNTFHQAGFLNKYSLKTTVSNFILITVLYNDISVLLDE